MQLANTAKNKLWRPHSVARRELERAVHSLKHEATGRLEFARRIELGGPGSTMEGPDLPGDGRRCGFAYDGKTFASLSEIARKITGTRWNGPRFFGLRACRRRS